MINRLAKGKRLLIIGLSFLIFANLWQWLVLRHTQLPESIRDFSSGLFFGIAITTLLLSVFFQARARRSG